MEEAATFLEFNAPAAYVVHAMRLTFMEKTGRYMTDHGHSLLEILRAAAADLSEGTEEQTIDESIFMHKFASSERSPWKTLQHRGAR